MQTRENSGEPATLLNHPSEGEWMEFCYREVSPATRYRLKQHLTDCAICAARVREWQKAMSTLDVVDLPVLTPATNTWRWPSVLRWGTAAAAILLAGFWLGRSTSGYDRELRELKASVSRLEQTAPMTSIQPVGEVPAARAQTVDEEMMRMLDNYARALSRQQFRDRQATALAVQNLETRIDGLRTELETVAVNTQEGLQETHQNLAQLAQFSRHQSKDTGSAIRRE